VIVTGIPGASNAGDKLVMAGAAPTLKLTPLLAVPPTVTITFPVVAPVGTVTAMFVALQLVTVAVVPLKLIVPEPCVEPKFVPTIVTEFPTTPESGNRPVITGAEDPDPGPLIDTLSNVAVARLELLSLLTASPMYTFCAIVTV
jgi:hypothetical protein